MVQWHALKIKTGVSDFSASPPETVGLLSIRAPMPNWMVQCWIWLKCAMSACVTLQSLVKQGADGAGAFNVAKDQNGVWPAWRHEQAV
jgi:hypothetical protein